MKLNYPVSDLTIAILAGGESSRFGGDAKALHHISGKTMLQYTLDKALQITNDVHLVIRHDMEGAIQYEGPVYSDLIKGKGPLGGIHAALKTSTRERLMVLPTDMPYLQVNTLKFFLNRVNTKAYDFAYLKAGDKVQPLISIYKNTQELIKVVEYLFSGGKSSAVMTLLRRVKAEEIPLSIEDRDAAEFHNINFPGDLKTSGQKGGTS